MISFTTLRGALEQGFIYGLVALSLYLSYRVLDIADMTTDGSFTLGAAVSAVVALAGHPWLALVLAVAAGMAAGCVTAFLQTKCKVQPILAGIITMIGLYSVNLMVMGGKANLSLLQCGTVFSLPEALLGKQAARLVITAAAALAAAAGLCLFLRTQIGLSIRATGDNRDMVSASSIDPAFTTTVGLCISNGIVGLAGGLLAQHQKFSDVTLGTGMVVVGLASLVIGEVLVGRGSIPRCAAGALVGSVIYRLIMALALRSPLGASSLKLVSAVIVAAAISWPAVKERAAFARRRREAKRSC